MYNLAFEIAQDAHEGQTRKDGEDYFRHCFRVSMKVASISEDAKIVGILHDTVEDTGVTLEFLKELEFSADIISAVDAITKRKEESYIDYILRVKNNNLARIVKLADLEDNLNGAKGNMRGKYELAYYILTHNLT